MTNTPRQRYGLGSFIKKIGRGAKKIAKSKLGKAALIGGGLYGLNRFGMPGGAGKGWFGKMMGTGPGKYLSGALLGRPDIAAGKNMGTRSGGLWNWMKGNPGRASMLGLGAAGMVMPFLGGDEEDEESITDWTIPSGAISGLLGKTKDYY